MQLISKFNKGFRFLLCVIDICSKYAWVIPLKDKKGITITNAFQKKKNWMNLTVNQNEGKSVIAERFIRTLKNKIYKYMTSKNVHVDKSDDIVNKYNNTYHSTIKIKPVDVKSSIYIDSSKENNSKDSKFKIGDIVRISKYKNIFANV